MSTRHMMPTSINARTSGCIEGDARPYSSWQVIIFFLSLLGKFSYFELLETHLNLAFGRGLTMERPTSFDTSSAALERRHLMTSQLHSLRMARHTVQVASVFLSPAG